MSPDARRIVVVGGSAAGLTAAETLREEGFEGELVVLNGERHAGYDRPPLSKQLLLGSIEPAALQLHPDDFFQRLRIDHRVGVRARGLDLSRRELSLDTGARLAFDGLVIATGLRPRPLPDQPSLAGLHMLRTLDDALALRAELQPGRRLVIIGAGFIGCELASTARELGLEVALVDPLPQPMARQLGPGLAGAVMQLHLGRGVQLHLGTGVQRFEAQGDRVSGVLLSDGTQLAADALLVAIGSLPNTEWLQGSGLDLSDGVMCDECCRAADGVYAAGDVANWRHPRLGLPMRLEHRMQATEQAMAAARNLLGAARPFEPQPYFWSEFHGVRLQVFGRVAPGDRFSVLSGQLGEAGSTFAWSRGGVVQAAGAWNAPRALRSLRGLPGQPVSGLEPAPTAA